MEFPSFKKNGRFEPMTFWLFFLPIKAVFHQLNSWQILNRLQKNMVFSCLVCIPICICRFLAFEGGIFFSISIAFHRYLETRTIPPVDQEMTGGPNVKQPNVWNNSARGRDWHQGLLNLGPLGPWEPRGSNPVKCRRKWGNAPHWCWCFRIDGYPLVI